MHIDRACECQLTVYVDRVVLELVEQKSDSRSSCSIEVSGKLSDFKSFQQFCLCFSWKGAKIFRKWIVIRDKNAITDVQTSLKYL